jgi:hypothetical protein
MSHQVRLHTLVMPCAALSLNVEIAHSALSVSTSIAQLSQDRRECMQLCRSAVGQLGWAAYYYSIEGPSTLFSCCNERVTLPTWSGEYGRTVEQRQLVKQWLRLTH